MLEQSSTLGSYVQVVCNFKIWFNPAVVHLLIQGAPDLHEYGLQGGAGLLTRTYATEKVPAYGPSGYRPWQEGLSFNFVNMHVQLLSGVSTAFVPYNTPIFSVYPILGAPYRFEDARAHASV